MAKFRKKIDNIEIHDPIGNPQESRVFDARDVAEDRPVAVKALPLDFFQSQKEFDTFVELTQRVKALRHPNLLVPDRVIGKYTEAFLVSDRVPGPNLRDFVNGQAPDVPRVNRLALDLMNGVQFLHSKKLLHRNLKATNVLIRPDGTACMCDMFYSPLFVRWRKAKGFPSVESVRYVSPEECLEKKLTVESDIYSLGILLFFAYTRVLPMRGQSAPELQMKHVKQVVREKPEVINPSVPPFISAMLLRMIAKAPKKRYRELGELILDMRRLDGNSAKPGARSLI